MEENNIQPNNSKISRTFWFWMFLVILIVIIGAAIFLFLNNNLSKKTANSVAENNDVSEEAHEEVKINTEIIQSGLLKLATLDFPETEQSAPISEEDIPSELKSLILKESENILVEQVIYSSKNSGYLINYQYQIVSEDLFEFENLFAQKNILDQNWLMINSRRATLFGFMEMENENYRTRIEYSKKENLPTIKVTVHIMEQ